MTQEQKQQVKNALMRYVAGYSTQCDAAEVLQGVSSTTISCIKNDNWELISERMWYQVARQVGFYSGDWNPADTGAYMLLRILLSDAQHYAMTYGISIATGLGKTFTAGHYVRENENAYYIACTEEHNRRSFLAEMLACIGIDFSGTVPQMLQQFINGIHGCSQPVLILDDAHKLKSRILHFIVTMVNSLTGRCGVILLGNDTFRQRVIDGVRLNKEAHNALYKCIGRRFITLGRLGPKDVALVCHANGLHDDMRIDFIASECNGSLHNIADLVQENNWSAAA